MTDIKTVPNQKVLTNVKSKCDSEHIYSLKTNKARDRALLELKGNTYKIWDLLIGNQDGYEFALSGTDIQKRCNISKKTYDAAIKDLIEKGYIVPKTMEHNTNRYWIFDDPDDAGQFLANEAQMLDKKETTELDKNYPLVKNSPTTLVKKVNDVGKKLPNQMYQNYQRNITDNTNKNTDRLQKSIYLSEKLEDKIKTFRNRAAAESAVKQLLKENFSEDWILTAINNKSSFIFEEHGFGLLFTDEYRQEIDQMIIETEEKLNREQDYWNAMFYSNSGSAFDLSKGDRITIKIPPPDPNKKKNTKRFKEIDLNTI